MAQVNVEVSQRTKELAKEKLNHGGLSDVIRDTLSRIAHGEATTERQKVQDELRDLRTKRKELKSDRAEIDEQLDLIEVKIERAEQRLNELQDKEGEYEGALTMLENEMQEKGMSVWPDHGKVKEVADIGSCSAGDVIGDLKERNNGFEDDRFQANL